MRRALLLLLVVAVAVVAPFFVYPVLLMTILSYAVFACSFNLLLGYTGLLCFGHAMFFGGAAYITGQVLKTTGASVEVAILAGALFSGLIGLFVGYLAIRRQGIRFALITLAFAELLYFIWLQSPFTGGEDGMQGIPRHPVFGLIDVSNDRTYYYVILAMAAFAIFAYYRIVHSPYGEILRAVRDNQPRVESLGFSPERVKLVAFVLSATMAGMAGGMKATVFHFTTLTDVSWPVSGQVILMTLLGGLGTLTGPVFGAAIIIWLNDRLSGFGQWALITQGVILLLVVTFFRRGFVGELAALGRLVMRRREKAPADREADAQPVSVQ